MEYETESSKQTNKTKKLIHTSYRAVVTRGEGVGEAEEGKEAQRYGDRKRLWVGGPEGTIWTKCYNFVHLELT